MTETEDDGPAGRAPRGLKMGRNRRSYYAACERIAELEAELDIERAGSQQALHNMQDAFDSYSFAANAEIENQKARAEKAEAEVERWKDGFLRLRNHDESLHGCNFGQHVEGYFIRGGGRESGAGPAETTKDVRSAANLAALCVCGLPNAPGYHSPERCINLYEARKERDG